MILVYLKVIVKVLFIKRSLENSNAQLLMIFQAKENVTKEQCLSSILILFHKLKWKAKLFKQHFLWMTQVGKYKDHWYKIKKKRSLKLY